MKKILVMLLVGLMFASNVNAMYDTKCFYDSNGNISGAVHTLLSEHNNSKAINASNATNSKYYEYYRECAPIFNQIDTFVTATSTGPIVDNTVALAQGTPVPSANNSSTTATSTSSGLTIVYAAPVYNDGPVSTTTKASMQATSASIPSTITQISSPMTKEQIMSKIQEIIQLINVLKIELEKITNQKTY